MSLRWLTKVSRKLDITPTLIAKVRAIDETSGSGPPIERHRINAACCNTTVRGDGHLSARAIQNIMELVSVGKQVDPLVVRPHKPLCEAALSLESSRYEDVNTCQDLGTCVQPPYFFNTVAREERARQRGSGPNTVKKLQEPPLLIQGFASAERDSLNIGIVALDPIQDV